MVAALFALALTALLALWAWRDRRDYERFKQFTRTQDRQRTYARWIAQAFVLFTLGALASLWALGALPALVTPPAAFAPLAERARAVLDDVGDGLLIGLAAAFVAAQLVASVFAARSSEIAVLGDVQALMPRNRAEYVWCALLSLNAGLGEELFFRLAYPLLLASVIGNALWAFALAALVFGAMHIYQGWVGVLATAVVGAVMTALYLATGSILWPILIHAAIDLRGLVLQPALTAWFRRRA